MVKYIDMKPKYDTNTQQQLDRINQADQVTKLTNALNALVKRVQTLEDARVVQIQLNSKYEQGFTIPKPLSSEEKTSIWDKLFK